MAIKDSIEELREVEKKPLWQRIGWLVGIWTASVVALLVVAMLMRMAMSAVGLTVH